MEKEKKNLLEISNSCYLVNLKLYSLIKELVQSQLTEKNLNEMYELLKKELKNINIDNSINLISINIKGNNENKEKKKEFLKNVFFELENERDKDILSLAIQLVLNRSILLSEAKIVSKEFIQKLSNEIENKLSLKYDILARKKPYSDRVVLALLLKILENGCNKNFLLTQSATYKKEINHLYNKLINYGIELSAIYQIFMDEVIKQSGVSEAGNSYEILIYNQLIENGFSENDIKTHCHDSKDNTIEYDFLIEKFGKTIGISAKRTLRERYKQNHKESEFLDVDILILITIGEDLNEDKLQRIIQKGTLIFIADEIKENKNYLKNNNFVYPTSLLTAKTIYKLLNIK